MTTFHLLYTADHNYFSHMLTSICSLAENNKNNNIRVHIIEDGFTKDDFYRLDQLTDLYDNISIKKYNVSKIKSLIEHYNIPKWRNTDIANARLFASEIIDETDKILYLDSDTLVVNDLKELFRKKIQNPLAAVKEIVIPGHLKKLGKEVYGSTIETYYNSGVILFDYDTWSQEDCLDSLYSVSKTINDELIYPDQDLINLTFQNQIDTLELSYNIPPLAKDLEKHKLLAKKFLKDRQFYYNYNELTSSLSEPHILHTLRYLNLSAWENTKVHPFAKEYEKYRKLWDKSFEPINRKKSIIYNTHLISDLNIVAKTFLKDESNKKIKQKILEKR